MPPHVHQRPTKSLRRPRAHFNTHIKRTITSNMVAIDDQGNRGKQVNIKFK
jgi:hypothetical protein